MSYRLVRKDGCLQVCHVYPNGAYEPEALLVPTAQDVDNMKHHLLALLTACDKPVMVEGADGKLEDEASVERAKEAMRNHRRSKPWL